MEFWIVGVVEACSDAALKCHPESTFSISRYEPNSEACPVQEKIFRMTLEGSDHIATPR